MKNYVWLIPTLPLAAFLVTLILGKWFINDKAHWIPILALAASFGLSVAAFIQIRGAELVGKVLQEAIDAGSGGAYFPVIATHIDRPSS